MKSKQAFFLFLYAAAGGVLLVAVAQWYRRASTSASKPEPGLSAPAGIPTTKHQRIEIDLGEPYTVEIASSLSSNSPPTKPEGRTTGMQDVVVHVGNWSAAVSPVDIEIQIDGMPVINQEFVAGDQNRVRFILRLPLGRHVISARSWKGGTFLSEDFMVDRPLTGLVVFTNGEGSPDTPRGRPLERNFLFQGFDYSVPALGNSESPKP